MVVGFGRLHWLSYMRDVYVVFYSSFVDSKSSRLRRIWGQFLESIMYRRHLKNQFKRWGKHLVKKAFIPDGKAQKMKTANAVLFNESKVTSIYRSVSEGQAHDAGGILCKARPPGKVYNWENNCEIEIGWPKKSIKQKEHLHR